MNKRLIVILIILLVLTINSCTTNTKNKTEDTENSDNVYFALFGVKYLEKDKAPEFNPELIKNKKYKSKFDKDLKNKLIELLNMPLIPLKKPEIDLVYSKDKGNYTEQKIFELP